MTASLALVVHETPNVKGHADYHLTSHEVINTPTGAVLGSGSIANRRDVDALLRVLTSVKDTGIELVDKHVIARGIETMVWYREANTKQVVRFLDPHASGAVEFVVSVPNMLFCRHKGALYAWAYKGRRRPTEKTKLYSAPFSNISDMGALCVGNNYLPNYVTSKDIDLLEKTFFESEFSHSAIDRISGIESFEEMVQFYRSLDGREHFPKNRLVPSPIITNLDDVWRLINV